MNEGHLERGSTVADRYVVEGLLGVGGLAEVYKVRHVDLGSLHALKVLTLRHKGLDERLRLEGQIQANLRHPNVVTVTDILRVDGQCGLLMEFVEGTSLESLIEQQGPLPYVDAMALFAPVLAAVAWAHDSGAVHRDLKPGNILLARTPIGWVPKVADFGIGKLVDDASVDTTTTGSRTRAGTAMGTPGYMAPEQARDSASVDKRADVFALAVILYEMLTGRLPYQNPDGSTDLTTTVLREVVPLDAPGVPREVAEAVARALDKDPERRFADARALAAALGLASHPLFTETTTGGHLRDLSRSASTGWSSGLPAPSRADAPAPHTTLEPATAGTSTYQSGVGGEPGGASSSRRRAWMAVALAAGLLLVSLAALGVSGSLALSKLGGAKDGPPAATSPPPPAERPSGDPSPPPPSPTIGDPAGAPASAPEPASAAAPPRPDAAVAAQLPEPPSAPPAPASPVEATPPAEPEPAPALPTPLTAAAPPAPSPEATTARAPGEPSVGARDLGGTWRGKAAGRPFELVLTQSGSSLSASAIFVAGSTRRVEKLSGSLDPATGGFQLQSNDGKIRFAGSLSGSSLTGTYLQQGSRELPFSVER